MDFVDKLMDKVTTDVDEEIPPLPAKDVIHRIYRDVGGFGLGCDRILNAKAACLDTVFERQNALQD